MHVTLSEWSGVDHALVGVPNHCHPDHEMLSMEPDVLIREVGLSHLCIIIS